MPAEELLLISDEPSTIALVSRIADGLNLKVRKKKDIRSAVKASMDYQIVIVDNCLPDGDCLECLQNLKTLNNDQMYIVFVDSVERKLGIRALKDNALYYIVKPVEHDELKVTVHRAMEFKKLRKEVRTLYQCTVEDFFRGKLKDYIPQIQKIGNIALYDTVISEVERALIKLAIEETGGNQVQASRLLGLNRNTIRNKLKKYKI
ncbi:MAG TPA: response regulator [Nitrospirae bacterium]|nr:response regulator [Nitrospirota bacterium]